MTVFDRRTPDGSRHFATIPLRAADGDAVGRRVRRLAKRLSEARILADSGESGRIGRIELRYRKHLFRLDWLHGLLRIAVDDPGCPEPIVLEVAAHFRALGRERRRRSGRRGGDASASDTSATECPATHGNGAPPASSRALFEELGRMAGRLA